MTEHEIKTQFAVMRDELAELEYHRWLKRSHANGHSMRRGKEYHHLTDVEKEPWRKMADEDLAIFDAYAKRIIAGHEHAHPNH